MGFAHALLSKKHTESHALVIFEYVTIATFEPRQLYYRFAVLI